MPTYEYKCESCGIRFERLQHFKDEPVKSCPECGSDVHRCIAPVGVIFKGSGFYVTDHKMSSTGSIGPAKTHEESKEPESKKPTESKPTDTKPAETKKAD